MSALRACLAAIAVIACAEPAFAFKNLQGCDIVMAASGQAPFTIAPDAWQIYRDDVRGILSSPASTVDELAAAADLLVAAQTTLLQPVTDTDSYREYLLGDKCHVLKSLTPEGIDAALAAADSATPASVLETARVIANAARTQVATITRSAKFRSGRDQTLLSARYYCFAAGTLQAIVSRDKQASMPLSAYGTTIGCKDAGRVE
ncbi:MAG: hypothetical protein ACM3MH_12160 [Actinomycetota bacterium]